jgi:hypothetical protein
MDYYTEAEKQDMLASFLAFNEKVTDKRYKQIIDSLP